MQEKLRAIGIKIKENSQYFWLIFAFIIFLVPRSIDLGSDVANIDARHWIPRSENFINSLLEGDFKHTYQKYHPGTTLMWIGGISYEIVSSSDSNSFIEEHFARKFPLEVLISLIAVVQFYYLLKLGNKTLAVFYITFLSFEPFFLGISRFFHLTALSTMFGMASALAFIYHLKTLKYKHIIFSAILFALGISTKVSLLINLPVYAIWYLLFLAYHFKDLKNLMFIKRVFMTPLLFTIVMVFSIYLINPFMWANPIWAIKKIYKEGILDTGFEEETQASITNNNMLFYLEYAFYRISPIALVAGGLGIITWFSQIPIMIYRKRIFSKYVPLILIYLVVYYILLSIPNKSRDRYLAELIPMFVFFAGYLFSLISLRKAYLNILLFFVLAIFYGSVISRYHPVYSFYYSELIGGPKGLLSVSIYPMIRGEYYAQAAQYLNDNDPDIENKTAWVLNAGSLDSFRYYFKGKSIRNTVGMKPTDKIDYVIVRFNDIDKFKDYCPTIQTFGPKYPYEFDAMYIVDCSHKNVLKITNKIQRI